MLSPSLLIYCSIVYNSIWSYILIYTQMHWNTLKYIYIYCLCFLLLIYIHSSNIIFKKALGPNATPNLPQISWNDLELEALQLTSSPSRAKWMGVGVPLNNSLGFKHHPLEGPGIYIYIIYTVYSKKPKKVDLWRGAYHIIYIYIHIKCEFYQPLNM